MGVRVSVPPQVRIFIRARPDRLERTARPSRTIQHDSDKKIVYSKVFTVEAATGATEDGAFQFVTDPIPVTMYRPQLADDYDITIGFDGAGGAGPAPKHRRAVSQQ